jgi:hypothetical protein
MRWSDYDNREFARPSDAEPPVVTKVASIVEEPSKFVEGMELVATFPDFRKVRLNKTRREALREICGSDDPQGAIGVAVEIFNDTTVRNPRNGEVGSLAFRRPGSSATGQPPRDDQTIDFGAKPKLKKKGGN